MVGIRLLLVAGLGSRQSAGFRGSRAMSGRRSCSRARAIVRRRAGAGSRRPRPGRSETRWSTPRPTPTASAYAGRQLRGEVWTLRSPSSQPAPASLRTWPNPDALRYSTEAAWLQSCTSTTAVDSLVTSRSPASTWPPGPSGPSTTGCLGGRRVALAIPRLQPPQPGAPRRSRGRVARGARAATVGSRVGAPATPDEHDAEVRERAGRSALQVRSRCECSSIGSAGRLTLLTVGGVEGGCREACPPPAAPWMVACADSHRSQHLGAR